MVPPVRHGPPGEIFRETRRKFAVMVSGMKKPPVILDTAEELRPFLYEIR